MVLFTPLRAVSRSRGGRSSLHVVRPFTLSTPLPTHSTACARALTHTHTHTHVLTHTHYGTLPNSVKEACKLELCTSCFEGDTSKSLVPTVPRQNEVSPPHQHKWRRSQDNAQAQCTVCQKFGKTSPPPPPAHTHTTHTHTHTLGESSWKALTARRNPYTPCNTPQARHHQVCNVSSAHSRDVMSQSATLASRSIESSPILLRRCTNRRNRDTHTHTPHTQHHHHPTQPNSIPTTPAHAPHPSLPHD